MGNCEACTSKMSVDIYSKNFKKSWSSSDNNGYSQLLND